MAAPTPFDVIDYLGGAGNEQLLERVLAHLPLVTEFVKAYTRGRGFDTTGDPTPDVAAVIVTATARLVTNPTLDKRTEIGQVSTTPGTLDGFTLPELAVLHRHRRRTA